ncbi:MAG TPA: hypothetical protein VGC86_17005, partial [Afipia sp.]
MAGLIQVSTCSAAKNCRPAAVLFAICMLMPHAARAQNVSSLEACLSAAQNFSLGAPLPRVASVLKSRQPLKIVAIGSSSTVGLWMTDQAKTYPEVMKRELIRLMPSA